MKKKVMRSWFIFLLILGLVIGYLLPGDVKTLTQKSLKPDVYNIPNKFGQLDRETEYLKYTVLAEAMTGGVELLRIDGKVPMHVHAKENHFAYVHKGRARITIGNSTDEAGPGSLVVLPAGIPHEVERVGDTPVEVMLFSTPPFSPKDTVYLDGKK